MTAQWNICIVATLRHGLQVALMRTLQNEVEVRGISVCFGFLPHNTDHNLQLTVSNITTNNADKYFNNTYKVRYANHARLYS